MSEQLGSDQCPLFEPAITWTMPLRPIGNFTGNDPAIKLLGRVAILGASFHVEAVEVDYTTEGEQVSKQDSDLNYFEEILNIVQGAAQTVTIDGREYVLAITPSAQ